MQNSDDDDLGFEEEFMDEAFDAEFDDSYDEFDADSAEMPDEDWDDDSEEDLIDDDLGSEKKKSGLSFNTIVIGGAVILGLGVFAFQVMTKKPSQVVGKFASALNMSGATDGPIFGERGDPAERVEKLTEEETTTEIEVGEQGFLFEPEILDEVEVSLSDSPPMPSPVSQVSEDNDLEIMSAEDDIVILDEEVDQVSEVVVSEEVIIDETEVTSLDSMIDDMAEEEAVEIIQIDVEPKVVEALIPQETAPSIIEQPIAPTQKTVATADISGLEKKLDMIVSRLDDMEDQIVEIRQTNQSQVKSLQKEVASISTSKPVVKSIPKKTAPKKVASKVVSWELRAAQPGKAWVSEKGQKQIKPVSVGDNLSGIGRITDISYISNKWVVQGTSGKIQQ